jgi:bacterioferritin-associated ferredoxin
VNERRVREEIERGARDEFDVARVCGAGAECGGCVPVITAILAETGCATRCPLASALQPSMTVRAGGETAALDSKPLRP